MRIGHEQRCEPVFNKVPEQVSFPAQEEAILELWDSLDAFEQSQVQRRKNGECPDFVFYDGPPLPPVRRTTATS